MNDSASLISRLSGIKRRRWLAGLIALVVVGGVAIWLLSQDRRPSVTMRIDNTSTTAYGLSIVYSMKLRGRKVYYFLEERRAGGVGSVMGGRAMSFQDWVYYLIVVNRLSGDGYDGGNIAVGPYPFEVVPPVGSDFRVYSGETKVILSTGEGEAKSELTLRCE